MGTQFNTKPITQLAVAAAVKATDVYAAVDVTDFTQSPIGSTNKYTMSQLQTYMTVALNNGAQSSCKAASTGNLTATYINGTAGVGATLTNAGSLAALVLDGVTLAVNDRVLIHAQSSNVQNGIYTVTAIGSATVPWVLTRATDYNNSPTGEIQQGDYVAVIEGTTQALSIWFQIHAGPIIIGTTPIVFQVSASEVVGTANQIAVTGNVISFADNPIIPGNLNVNGTNGLTIGTEGGSVIWNVAHFRSFEPIVFASSNTTDARLRFFSDTFEFSLGDSSNSFQVIGTASKLLLRCISDTGEVSTGVSRNILDNGSGGSEWTGNAIYHASVEVDLSGYFNTRGLPLANALNVSGDGGATIFNVNTITNATTTLNNTLDDGSGASSWGGDMAVSGNISAVNFLPLKAKGSYTPSTAGTSDAITVSGITTSDIAVVFPSVASANPYFIISQACTANTLTVTYNTAPGTGGTMQYIIYGP